MEQDPVTQALYNALEAEVLLSTASSTLSDRGSSDRTKATLEFGMRPEGHLAPAGVSQIVSSDTVEAVEGLNAVVSELVLDNDKLAAFEGASNSPKSMHSAQVANDVINYEVFQRNEGWVKLNNFLKAALLWRNAVMYLPFEERRDKVYEEYDKITQTKLDFLLAEEGSALDGYESADSVLIGSDYEMVYSGARISRVKDNSRVGLHLIPPENFLKSTESDDLADCRLVGFVQTMTRSAIRERWGEAVPELLSTDGDVFNRSSWIDEATEERQARRDLVNGTSTYSDREPDHEPLMETNVIFAWMQYDIDGDGITELVQVEALPGMILSYKTVEFVPLADLGVFKIPFEWESLSAADMVRPTTMATTAVMRGFVENVYLTNYSPKLADPNVVDFNLLQNIRPKQVIPTNGNPQAAVFPLAPDTISTGTVPLLEALQAHKEQATGLSKASQGLNDTLYVSGNSEAKLQRVMSASQIRLQHLARRMIETGFRRVATIVYKQLQLNFSENPYRYTDRRSNEQFINPGDWPDINFFRVKAGVGENSDANKLQKLNVIGTQVLPALRQAGAGGVISPTAPAMLAFKTLEAMGVDPLLYLVDPTTEEFQAKAEEDRKRQMEAENKSAELKQRVEELDIEQRKATIALTNIQSRNAMQDNARQLMIAMDTSFQKWAEIHFKYLEKGVEKMPPRPSIQELLQIAQSVVMASKASEDASGIQGTPEGKPEGTIAEPSGQPAGT